MLSSCVLSSCVLRVASCELRVTGCVLRVAGCELRVVEFSLFLKGLDLRISDELWPVNTGLKFLGI